MDSERTAGLLLSDNCAKTSTSVTAPKRTRVERYSPGSLKTPMPRLYLPAMKLIRLSGQPLYVANANNLHTASLTNQTMTILPPRVVLAAEMDHVVRELLLKCRPIEKSSLNTVPATTVLSVSPPIEAQSEANNAAAVFGNAFESTIYKTARTVEELLLSPRARTARVDKDWTRSRRHYT
jgi:hypothetical protein